MRIAIPKGRLQENTLTLFAAAGYDVPTESDLRTRKLVFTLQPLTDCEVA